MINIVSTKKSNNNNNKKSVSKYYEDQADKRTFTYWRSIAHRFVKITVAWVV